MSLMLLQAVRELDMARHLTRHIGSTVDGALFVLQSPLSVGLSLAAVLALAPLPRRRALLSALAFALVTIGSGWLPDSVAGSVLVPASWLAPMLLLFVGAPIAMGVRLQGLNAWVVLLGAGIGAGVSGGFQTATVDEITGASMALFVLVAAGLLMVGAVHLPERVVRAATLARRMTGAWMAAVGILLLALLLRRGT